LVLHQQIVYMMPLHKWEKFCRFSRVFDYLQVELFELNGNAVAAKFVRYHLRNRQNLLTQKCQSYSLHSLIDISCFLSFPQNHI